MAARRVGYASAAAGIVASFGILVATWLLQKSYPCAEVEKSFAASAGLVHLACEPVGTSVMAKARHERFPGDVVLPVSAQEKQQSLVALAVDLLRQMTSDSFPDQDYLSALRAVNASFTFPKWSDEALVVARKLKVPFIDSEQIKIAAETDGIIASPDDVHFAATVVMRGYLEVGDGVTLLTGLPLLNTVGSRAEANVEVVDGGVGPKVVAASRIEAGSRLEYFRGAVSPLESLGRFGVSDLASNVINLDPLTGVGQSVASKLDDFLSQDCGQQLRRPTVFSSGELSAQKCRQDMEVVLNASGKNKELKAWARLASQCGKQLKDLRELESALDLLRSRSDLDRHVAMAVDKQKQLLAKCRSYYKKKSQASRGDKVSSPKADVPPTTSSPPTKEVPKIRMKDGSPFTIWKKAEVKDGPVRMVAKPPQQQPKSTVDTRLQYGEHLEDEDVVDSNPASERPKAPESPLPASSRGTAIHRDQEANLPPKPAKGKPLAKHGDAASYKYPAKTDNKAVEETEAEEKAVQVARETAVEEQVAKEEAVEEQVAKEEAVEEQVAQEKAAQEKAAEEKRRVRERRLAREKRQKDQEERERLMEAREAGEEMELADAAPMSTRSPSLQGSIPAKPKTKKTPPAGEKARQGRSTAGEVPTAKSGVLPQKSSPDFDAEGKEGLPRKRKQGVGLKQHADPDQPLSKEAPFPKSQNPPNLDSGTRSPASKTITRGAVEASPEAPSQKVSSRSQEGLPKNKESVPKPKQGRTRPPREARSAAPDVAAAESSSAVAGSLRSKSVPEPVVQSRSPVVSDVRGSEGVMASIAPQNPQKPQRRHTESIVSSASGPRSEARLGADPAHEQWVAPPEVVAGAVASRQRSERDPRPEARPGSEDPGKVHLGESAFADSQPFEGVPRKRR
mmetsp:Transcript_12213/g.30483  ORF Transcript_12213/g.30483 Transcript_12213/m.30483 type:complete len:906 (+) Transcript_12213:78-2795(+)